MVRKMPYKPRFAEPGGAKDGHSALLSGRDVVEQHLQLVQQQICSRIVAESIGDDVREALIDRSFRQFSRGGIKVIKACHAVSPASEEQS